MKVKISGRDVAPTARILEVLTKCNLLDKRVTWVEGEVIVLFIDNPTEQDRREFEKKYEVLN